MAALIFDETNAIHGKGTVMTYGVKKGTKTPRYFGEVISYGPLSAERGDIDVTSFSNKDTDVGWLRRDFIRGLYQENFFQVTCNYPQDPYSTLPCKWPTTPVPPYAYYSFKELWDLMPKTGDCDRVTVEGAQTLTITLTDGTYFSFEADLWDLVTDSSVDAQLTFVATFKQVSDIEYTAPNWPATASSEATENCYDNE